MFNSVPLNADCLGFAAMNTLSPICRGTTYNDIKYVQAIQGTTSFDRGRNANVGRYLSRSLEEDDEGECPPIRIKKWRYPTNCEYSLRPLSF